MLARDHSAVSQRMAEALKFANDVNMDPTPPSHRDPAASGRAGTSSCSSLNAADRQDILRFSLQRFAKERMPCSFEWLCGLVLSTTMDTDVARVNPFHGSVGKLQAAVCECMVRAHRMVLIRAAIQQARNLSSFIASCVKVVQQQANAPSSMPRADSSAYVDRQDSVLGDRTNSAEGLVSAASMKERFDLLSAQLVDMITVRRNYATVAKNEAGQSVARVDPRFVVFEYIFSIVLRPRQVEMVRWFLANLQQGRSRVQQMIMGQGKTTVVGPLLALILADGETLVTQVMPTALLEQTRNVLRRCFSVVVPKRILTLQFDRGCDDEPDHIKALYSKLLAAREHRAIVVSAPECIKALTLKFIEQLHAVEQSTTSDATVLFSNTKGHVDAEHGVTIASRSDRETQKIRQMLVSRSQMADAIVPILDLWGIAGGALVGKSHLELTTTTAGRSGGGVLLMDEVDVLLHPLKSELNFPIGDKLPIDLSGPRWLLPMHVMDALFHSRTGRVTDSIAYSSSSFGAQSNSADREPHWGFATAVDEALHVRNVLQRIDDVLEQGMANCSLLHEPHVALLDPVFYHRDLRPALEPWLLLWLSRNMQIPLALPGVPAVAVQRSPDAEMIRQRGAVAQQFLSIGDLPSMHVEAHATFSEADLQLLNLSRLWITTILPHVLSKVNRVSFGLLQASDLSLYTPETLAKMPTSRRLMAVPFLAKDVPSRSSEFAHPDVVIGLSVLAYRYEGLRIEDVKAMLTVLKQDFARQTGPRERRPAAQTYNSWMNLVLSAANASQQQQLLTANNADSGAHLAILTTSGSGAVPLGQLQIQDNLQLRSMHEALRYLPEATYYYLSQMVFPRTMNFQQLKVSACGHELGSDILFQRRVGFSGTPSNLLPMDLGDCSYEPGSDGRILTV